MAEPAAVVPVYAGFVGHKGNGGGLLGADLHTHTMVHQHEAVRHVLDHVDVGDHHGHFIALLDLELVDAPRRPPRRHIPTPSVPPTAHLPPAPPPPPPLLPPSHRPAPPTPPPAPTPLPPTLAT